MRKQNNSLMVKCWCKLDTQKGIWQDIIKARYLKNCSIATVKPRFSYPPCWKAILKVKDLYMMGRRIHIGASDIARLWKYPIKRLIPLCDKCPQLFDICNV